MIQRQRVVPKSIPSQNSVNNVGIVMGQKKTIAVDDEKSPHKGFASEPTAVIKSNHCLNNHDQTINNGDKSQYFA